MSRLFARHTGRHCRRLFSYSVQVSPVDDFSQVRVPPALAPFPMAADLIPFPAPRYTRPYDSPKGDAA